MILSQGPTDGATVHHDKSDGPRYRGHHEGLQHLREPKPVDKSDAEPGDEEVASIKPGTEKSS